MGAKSLSRVEHMVIAAVVSSVATTSSDETCRIYSAIVSHILFPGESLDRSKT